MAEVTIHLSTDDRDDQEILNRIFGAPEPTVTVTHNNAVEQVVPAPEAPAPAPKATAKPKATPKPEPVVEEPVEDLLNEPSTDFAGLRETAVSTATTLVTGGQSAKVKEALTELGVKRVSELADGQLEAFIAALA